ncbi:MAG: glycosyltransferase [Lacibacter sp.]
MPKKSQPAILHLVTWYPTKENHVEGIFIQRHIELLASNKDYRHVVVRKNVQSVSVLQHLKAIAGISKQEIIGDMPVLLLPDKSGLYKKYFWRHQNAIEQFILNRLVKKIQPALLHLHVVYGFGKEAVQLKKLFGIPFIVTEHISPFPFEWLTDKQATVIEPTREAAAVAAVGKVQASQIEDYTGVKPFVIHNVVRSDYFFYHERSKKEPSKGPDIVLTGIYDPRKGVDYLLQSFPALLKKHPGSRLHLAGTASLERMAVIEKEVEAGGIQHAVKFHGQLTPADLCKLYHQCDFYVCSSEMESFGVSILEALFTGLPVLSTKCGGVLEFMLPENGILIENDRTVETLLNGLLDMTERLNSFNRQAISADAVDRFSTNRIRENYLSLYQQVLAKP